MNKNEIKEQASKAINKFNVAKGIYEYWYTHLGPYEEKTIQMQNKATKYGLLASLWTNTKNGRTSWAKDWNDKIHTYRYDREAKQWIKT